MIAAAVSLFAHAGYFGTNTTEIAHAADISQPYLYRLYRNKEDLFVAALGAAKELLVAQMDTDFLRSGDEPVGDALLRAAVTPPPQTIADAVRDCYRNQVDRLSALGADAAAIRAYLAWSQYSNAVRSSGVDAGSADPRDRTLLPPAR